MTIPNDPLFWLHSGNFRTFNIHVAKKLDSVKAALMLSEISDRYRYHRENNLLINSAKHGDAWVEFSVEDCKERIWLSDKEQRNAISILEAWDLIEKQIIGQNPKRCFRLKTDKIMKVFFGCEIESSKKSDSEKPPENDCQGEESDLPKSQNRNCQKGGSGQYIYEPTNTNLYNTPPSPQSGDAAAAADDDFSSSSSPPKKEDPPDKPKTASSEAIKLESEIVSHMKSHEPSWNAPKTHRIALCCDELLLAGSTYRQILNVVLWVLESEYWASALFNPKKNPGTVLKERFSQWSAQMKAEQKSKYKKGSDRRVRVDGVVVENEYKHLF